MDDVTVINNLFVPEVVAGEIVTKLVNNIQFVNYAKFRDTLKGRAGDTVTRYKYSYIGDAEEFTEGNDISYGVLTQVPTTMTIKKAGRGVKLTDEAVLNGIGDPEGEAVKQIRLAIASKVDNDCVTALENIAPAMTVGDGSEKIGTNLVQLALEKFDEEDGDDESVKVLFIKNTQKKDIMNDANFVKGSEIGAGMLVKGAIGEILGCQIKVSKKVKDVAGKVNNFILKGQPLAIEIKRDVMPERDRDIDAKITKCNADIHYGVYLEEDQNAVKIVSKGESAVVPSL
jgi:N4-gp56 family major capsid protein